MKAKVAALLMALSFASTAYGRQAARMIDAFGLIRCDDVKTRLDSSAIEVQKDPTAKLRIIFYGGKSYFNSLYDRRTGDYTLARRLLPKRDEARARVSWWKPYIIDTRGVDASRIEVVDGGYRPEFTVEFWIVPSGANPPTLKPTLTEKDIRFRRGKPNCKEMFGPNSECGCAGFQADLISPALILSEKVWQLHRLKRG